MLMHMDGLGLWWLLPPAVMVLMMVLCGLMCRRMGCMPFCRPDKGGKVQESPLDILKRRYASGEVSAQEYERMKKDLLE